MERKCCWRYTTNYSISMIFLAFRTAKRIDLETLNHAFSIKQYQKEMEKKLFQGTSIRLICVLSQRDSFLPSPFLHLSAKLLARNRLLCSWNFSHLQEQCERTALHALMIGAKDLNHASYGHNSPNRRYMWLLELFITNRTCKGVGTGLVQLGTNQNQWIWEYTFPVWCSQFMIFLPDWKWGFEKQPQTPFIFRNLFFFPESQMLNSCIPKNNSNADRDAVKTKQVQ